MQQYNYKELLNNLIYPEYRSVGLFRIPISARQLREAGSPRSATTVMRVAGRLRLPCVLQLTP